MMFMHVMAADTPPIKILWPGLLINVAFYAGILTVLALIAIVLYMRWSAARKG